MAAAEILVPWSRTYIKKEEGLLTSDMCLIQDILVPGLFSPTKPTKGKNSVLVLDMRHSYVNVMDIVDSYLMGPKLLILYPVICVV